MKVELPDKSIIESTHTGHLPIEGLPLDATRAYLFPDLGDTSLISIGQLCDHGYQAHFTATSVDITRSDRVILQGTRNDETRGLWMLSIPAQSRAMAVNHCAAPEQQVAFAHAALFSPAISTLKTALARGYLPPFPGLTSKP